MVQHSKTQSSMQRNVSWGCMCPSHPVSFSATRVLCFEVYHQVYFWGYFPLPCIIHRHFLQEISWWSLSVMWSDSWRNQSDTCIELHPKWRGKKKNGSKINEEIMLEVFQNMVKNKVTDARIPPKNEAL